MNLLGCVAAIEFAVLLPDQCILSVLKTESHGENEGHVLRLVSL
jgi:hypothetical protein